MNKQNTLLSIRYNQSRQKFIIILRCIAMCMVFTPHIIAYTIDNNFIRYIAYYIFNPFHIIQCCGAIGVSIFFITSGYLTYNQIGTCKTKRFIKSIILIIQTFFAIIFLFVICNIFIYFFKKIGYHSPYEIYTIKDWIETALLYRNIFYLKSVEPAIWFLIPFLLFKFTFIILDYITRSNAKLILLFYWIIFIILYFINNDIVKLFSSRSPFIGIILIGFIFALYHDNKITKSIFCISLLINIYIIVYGSIINVYNTIDSGYIISIIYGTILFYIFYKLKDIITVNNHFLFFDKIGLSFYLLHNCLGKLFIYFFYNFLNFNFYISLLLTIPIIFTLFVIHNNFIKNNIDLFMKKYILSIKK